MQRSTASRSTARGAAARAPAVSSAACTHSRVSSEKPAHQWSGPFLRVVYVTHSKWARPRDSSVSVPYSRWRSPMVQSDQVQHLKPRRPPTDGKIAMVPLLLRGIDFAASRTISYIKHVSYIK